MKIPQLPKVRLSQERYGANIILGIEGQKAEIERFFIFLHNYGGTPRDCELEWLNDEFAKLQTDEERLFNAYYAYNYIYLTVNERINSHVADGKSKHIAKETIENLDRDYYLVSHSVGNLGGH